MIQSRNLGFLLFTFMMVIFFVIPDIEGIQKPFRILLCLFFPLIYFSLLIKKEISYNTLFPIAVVTVLMIFMAMRGTLQSSFVNALLCLFGILSLKFLLFELTAERKENLRYIFLLAVLSILIQLMILTNEHGKPTLIYQFNLSGAYLFLFFIVADILGYKWGKLLVIVISLFMLNRLLIFSIVIFYLIKFGKIYFEKIIRPLNASIIILGSFAFISLFSLWYTSSIQSETPYETGYQRLIHLNDGSNELRFNANTVVLNEILTLSPDPQILFGYGRVENFLKAKKSPMMPHNELFFSIVEIGLFAVIILSFFTMPAFNKLVSFGNLEFFIPILFHTLLLWVRYLIFPTPEMLFILFLLFMANKDTKQIKIFITENKVQSIN